MADDAGVEPAAGGAAPAAGKSGSHPTRLAQPLLVAPTTGDGFNTLSLDLVAVACVQLPDVLFEFDSSFPTPGVAAMLQQVPVLRRSHVGATGLLPPLSVFGHADPTGDDGYNKILSGRRAMAIYAALTHDLALWNFLFDHPHGGDDWKTKKVSATMAAALGQPAGTPRDALSAAYMLLLSPEPVGKGEFIGQGADAKGKADFQGCSEFNPLILLSVKENQTLAKPERNEANAPNRRVIVFMFRPGTKVDPGRWPCPRALEGPAPCSKRFFGPPRTGEQRRQAGPERREFAQTLDTFACRFYDRIARLSPCELPVPPAPVVTPSIVLPPLARSDLVTASGGSTGPARDFVIVRKPTITPARVPVTLKADKDFDGGGTFTVSDRDKIRFFTTQDGTTPLAFDGFDNTFSGPRLIAGVTLFAEGVKASAALLDITLTLTLSAVLATIATVARAQITALDLQLDIHEPRTDDAKDPPALTQPPASPPAVNPPPKDKFFGGRFLPQQDAQNTQERAMLEVRIRPADFKGTLELTAQPNSVEAFDVEKPPTGSQPAQTAQKLPLGFESSTVPAAGRRFFIQGTALSGTLRDIELRLGIKGVEPAGDHVTVTVTPSLVLRTSAAVACPGLDFRIDAITSATGTFSWVHDGGTTTRFVDAAGAPVAVPATSTIRLRSFNPDNAKGELPERKFRVTLTFTSNGIAAPYVRVVTVHKVQFVVNNMVVTPGVTRANEGAAQVLLANAPGVATMATNPNVTISLAATCPQPAACAGNHRLGWLQTVRTNQRDARYTDTLVQVTVPLPIRDALTTVVPLPPQPFYGQTALFVGNGDVQNAPHSDSPQQGAAFSISPPALPGQPPPPANQPLRSVQFSNAFTAWLSVENQAWRRIDPNTALLFLRNFDWSMQLNVAVTVTQPVGSRCVPIQNPAVIGAVGNGRGGNVPNLAAPVANNSANRTVNPAPHIP